MRGRRGVRARCGVRGWRGVWWGGVGEGAAECFNMWVCVSSHMSSHETVICVVCVVQCDAKDNVCSHKSQRRATAGAEASLGNCIDVSFFYNDNKHSKSESVMSVWSVASLGVVMHATGTQSRLNL